MADRVGSFLSRARGRTSAGAPGRFRVGAHAAHSAVDGEGRAFYHGGSAEAISMIVQPRGQVSARRPYLPALATVATVIVPGLAGTIATARATQRT